MTPKYKRMLAAMAGKSSKNSRKHKKEWSVYILRCADGSLYTGISNDVLRRLGMHNKGSGARYTRTRRPVQLVYQQNSMTRPQALVRECVIKGLSKKAKESLVAG